MIELKLGRVGRRRANIVDIHLVGLEVVLQEIVPLKDRVLVRMHHAGACLNVQLRILLPLHLLQRPSSVDRLVPTSLFSSDLLVSLFQPIDPESDGDVQFRTFVHDAGNIRKYPGMDLPVGHKIDRIELVVLIESSYDLRQILSSERFAAGEHKNTEVAAQRFRDAGDLMGLHLELLSRSVVQFVCEEAMRAPHIANTRYQNVKENGRHLPSDDHARIPLKYLFCRKIHYFLNCPWSTLPPIL